MDVALLQQRVDLHLDRFFGGADLASDMLADYSETAMPAGQTSSTWNMSAAPQALRGGAAAVPPGGGIFNLAGLPSSLLDAHPPDSLQSRGTRFQLSVVDPGGQQYPQREFQPQAQQQGGEQHHVPLFDTPPTVSSFSPNQFLNDAAVRIPAVVSAASMTPAAAVETQQRSPYSATSKVSSNGRHSSVGYGSGGSSPAYEIPEQIPIVPVQARVGGVKGVIDDALWATSNNLTADPDAVLEGNLSMALQQVTRVNWMHRVAMERAGADPRIFDTPAGRRGDASPVYSAGSSSSDGNSAATDEGFNNSSSADSTGSASPPHASMGEESIRNKQGKWNVWALSLGAKARNTATKTYMLTPEEAEDLKKQSRKLKQSMAQQKYLKKKREARQEAKRNAKASGLKPRRISKPNADAPAAR